MKALRMKDMMKPQSKSRYFTSLRLNATEPSWLQSRLLN
ncbi:conserved hypothetical protein [Xenorhabdus nematophila F1]|nr:conserved hypothetical protein [Xenorhabdus nematophila F1]